MTESQGRDKLINKMLCAVNLQMIYLSVISLEDINTPDCLKTRLLHSARLGPLELGWVKKLTWIKGYNLDFSALYAQCFYFFNVPQ